MANAISANRAELLAIANSVATEKLIDKAIVIEAIEEAIQRAARARFGQENDIRAKLDPMTGDLRLWRVVEVVDQVDDYFKQVDLKAAQKRGIVVFNAPFSNTRSVAELVLGQLLLLFVILETNLSGMLIILRCLKHRIMV